MSEEEELRLVIKTKFRPQVRTIMEEMRRDYRMEIREVVYDLQLAILLQYEQQKESSDQPAREDLERQEMAILELIAELGQEMDLGHNIG